MAIIMTKYFHQPWNSTKSKIVHFGLCLIHFFSSRLKRRLAQFEQERAMERAHMERMSAKRQAEMLAQLREDRVGLIVLANNRSFAFSGT